LIEQSEQFHSINERHAYTDLDLPSEYFEMFPGLVENYRIGYGLYSWKSYLIRSELAKLRLNDILIYIDAGCELNPNGIRRFEDYLSFTAKNDLLLFEQRHPNRFWTKNHPKLLGYPEHYFRNQLVGGIVFVKKNERSERIIQAWLELCSYDGGTLLKDPGDSEPQVPGFKSHRHDQSCLSVCAYQHEVATMPDETWFQDWKSARDYPILTFRNRTGSSELQKKLKKFSIKDYFR
jgi:hypothetical protein